MKAFFKRFVLSRSTRNYIATALFGLALATMATHFKTFFDLIGSRPLQPDPSRGLIYPLSNHGTYYYVTHLESASQSTLFWLGWWAILMAIAIVPKEIKLPPQGTPKWLTWISASGDTDLSKPDRRRRIVFACSFLISLAVMVFAGQHLILLFI